MIRPFAVAVAVALLAGCSLAGQREPSPPPVIVAPPAPPPIVYRAPARKLTKRERRLLNEAEQHIDSAQRTLNWLRGNPPPPEDPTAPSGH